MVTVLSDSTPIARKEHNCDASLFITEGGRPDYFDCIDDYRAYIRAKQNRFKIQIGEKYIRQSNVTDGDFYCFKAIAEMHRICIKYDLYPDY
jgi:hypothetical protein